MHSLRSDYPCLLLALHKRGRVRFHGLIAISPKGVNPFLFIFARFDRALYEGIVHLPRSPHTTALPEMTTEFIDSHDASVFHTTRWTRVGLAKLPSEEGRRALAELCEIYYEPVLV